MTIFFYGPNSYGLRGQLHEMIATYLKKSGSDFGLERINGESIRPHELVAILTASPFLANSRLVIVEGLALNKAIAEKLPGIMAGVPKSTVAVFADREVDQRTSTFRQLAKADKVVKFELVTGPKLLGWVRSEIELQGGTAEPEALRELVVMVGEDQWRLSGEINKLVNYDLHVRVEHVRELVALSVEQSIFKLVEAMTDGNSEEALSGYYRLLERNESEIYVLTMVQWQLRNWLLAKMAPGQMSPQELAKAAGMSPYVAAKMVAAQSTVSRAELVRAYLAAGQCEYDIKSGRMKAQVAVEQLIYGVALRMRPRKSAAD
jgi:DNA polymerase-3 subunit delta